MVMIFCTTSLFAQSNSKNDVPATILASFTAKYPKAEIKKWEVTSDGYTAKVIEDHNKFEASFDKNSQWVKTTTKIGWSWDLPAEIRTALKDSKYKDWRVDRLRKVETPAGEFYQVLVDNMYLQIDGAHTGFTEDLVLNFKPSGNLFAAQSIKSPLLF